MTGVRRPYRGRPGDLSVAGDVVQTVRRSLDALLVREPVEQ